MKPALYDHQTLYDFLDVVPAADHLTLIDSYRRKIREQIGELGEPNGSMWWYHRLQEITRMTEAMKILAHRDRRDQYNKELLAAGRLCPLCSGSGRMLVTRMSDGVRCSACEGTGKGWDFAA